MYVLVTNGTAIYYSLSSLYSDNPDTSFPVPTPDSTLAEYNVYPCLVVNPPVVDYTENVTLGDPALVGGEWTQTWITTPATSEEIAQRELDMQNANKARASTELYETDYTDLPHTASQITNIQDVLAYRQALRQIALAPPVTVQNWPVRPAIIWST
jgi:hypothetical protein